ncbi:MAG: rRNA maturation RNase YbeY [Deltaproteobacteria bacterium]|nr:rRNA maturation RNase YbeY [Deltaproteobacteria bacterium]
MKVLVQDETKTKKGSLIKKIAGSALKDLGFKGREVSVLITDDDRIQELNKTYRNKNKPTDVLSFPMDDEQLLGDIVISMDTAKAQAESFKVSLDEELSRLLVHGLLHLLGYDHVKGGHQAKKMRAKEDELMSGLKEKGFF